MASGNTWAYPFSTDNEVKSVLADNRRAFLMGENELAWCYRVQVGLPGALDAAGLRQLQLERLNATLQHAFNNSRFYRQHLPVDHLDSLEALAKLPLTDPAVLGECFAGLLCVSPAAVGRIVSLPTSGTTGKAKRVAFSPADHQQIVDYLAAGMRMLTGQQSMLSRQCGVPSDPTGETIAVLYPCQTPASLGALICEAVTRIGAQALAQGIPESFPALAAAFQRHRVSAAVGFPQHLLAFARWCEHHGIELDLRRLLLSADNAAGSLCRELRRIWDAEVFVHYGMTEMGYGGAVECPCHHGLHIRETDLLVEVVDPQSGRTLPDGQWGELVFTTLGCQAMPLVRYRSGDRVRLLPGKCGCGSILKRIDGPAGRLGDTAGLQGAHINLPELEECIFGLSGVLDFEVAFDAANAALRLRVIALPGSTLGEQSLSQALRPLFSSDVAAPAAAMGAPSNVQFRHCSSRAAMTGFLPDRRIHSIQIHLEVADDFFPCYAGKRFVKRFDSGGVPNQCPESAPCSPEPKKKGCPK